MLCNAKSVTGKLCSTNVKMFGMCHRHMDIVGLDVHWSKIPDLPTGFDVDVQEHTILLKNLFDMTKTPGWESQISIDFGDNLCSRPTNPNLVSSGFLAVSDHEAFMIRKWTNDVPCPLSGLISNVCHKLGTEILQ